MSNSLGPGLESGHLTGKGKKKKKPVLSLHLHTRDPKVLISGAHGLSPVLRCWVHGQPPSCVFAPAVFWFSLLDLTGLFCSSPEDQTWIYSSLPWQTTENSSSTEQVSRICSTSCVPISVSGYLTPRYLSPTREMYVLFSNPFSRLCLQLIPKSSESNPLSLLLQCFCPNPGPQHCLLGLLQSHCNPPPLLSSLFTKIYN